jgi:hypothetical protein
MDSVLWPKEGADQGRGDSFRAVTDPWMMDSYARCASLWLHSRLTQRPWWWPWHQHCRAIQLGELSIGGSCPRCAPLVIVGWKAGWMLMADMHKRVLGQSLNHGAEKGEGCGPAFKSCGAEDGNSSNE